MKKYISILLIILVSIVASYCSSSTESIVKDSERPEINNSSHHEMMKLLKQVEQMSFSIKNDFNPQAKLQHIESLLRKENLPILKKQYYKFLEADLLLQLGKEDKAIPILEALESQNLRFNEEVQRKLGMAYLRFAERTNCINNHAAESCIMPFNGLGIHKNTSASEQAIKMYEKILSVNYNDLESRWLLNIAYMTIGRYPQGVPKQYLTPGMEGDTLEKVEPFVDIAGDLGLDVNNMAGGVIAEDFNNDGFIDLVTSSLYVTDELHYFKNNGDGTFTDLSKSSGLQSISGGLNINQTDFNNDGHKDIFVLRGGWQNNFGKEPNSLIRNNGDGTFTDITTKSGLLSFHPTQTATWNDFNNDGLLDVFIGNESVNNYEHPCELYLNNGDETFREVASLSKCDIRAFVKGVTSGDYDNDGWTDLFISTTVGQRFLLRNKGVQNGKISFEDVTVSAGIAEAKNNTFPTWFWDYNNDGWLDIFVCDYTFTESLGVYAAYEKLGRAVGPPDKMLLYRNNQDGTFTNVSKETGLITNVFAMGSNFGDINNDGFLDMYLGTGNPNLQSVIPNKLFLNKGGKKFADVTASARVGHLQKGHGVAFTDFDHDGDQDIYIDMGGALPGDAYQSALFMNQIQSGNNWISLELVGTTTNKSAIGSRVIVHITENGAKRKIVRDVNSGGSFGSSPLRREIGIGKAASVDKIEIQWLGSKEIQTLEKLPANAFYKITQGSDQIEKLSRQQISWNVIPLCEPITNTSLKL